MAWNKGTAESRGYGWKWKKLRSRILLRDRYLCQISLKAGLLVPATEVDHIVSKAVWLREHGNLDHVDDDSNLQAVSHAEHEKKTLAERGFVSKTGGDVTGMPLDPNHAWNRE